MRIVALDIIRFFAALSVVLYHFVSRPSSDAYPILSEFTKYGYLGVPLFFIISGYVIALSAHNRTAIQFGVSRFVRLYPALWAGVIFTVIALYCLSGKEHSILQILANFTLLNEYFGFANIDGVYWTLKIELKFYACIFLLIAFGVYRKHEIWLSLWMLLSVMHTVFDQPFFMGWFISPEYSSFFIAGVALFLIQRDGKNLYNCSILIWSLLVSSIRCFGQAIGFIESATVSERLIAVGIIWLIYGVMFLLSTGKFDMKERGIYVILGALTYPLYLIHNLVGKALIDNFKHFISEEVLIFLVVILMVFTSWLIHLCIEKPLATPLKIYILSILESKKHLVRRF